jgi:FemAB-related protein (PEP-CTERM system-associated)
MQVAITVEPPRAESISVGGMSDPALVEAYVGTHPAATAYHHPAWLQVIQRAFGHQTRYLVASVDGRITGVLPFALFGSRLFGRFAVSLPFLNYGGILADDDAAAQALLDAAVADVVDHGGTHLELRHTAQRFPALTARRHKVAMRLALASTPDDQWTALDRKVRNQVRKAEKSGLQLADGGAELLDGFYTVFARNMRDLGTPVYGVRFFKEVLNSFPESTRVFVVTLGDQPIAASIVVWHRDTIEVPWASAIREFNPLCANVLLYWGMLRFANERGFRVFDFGRSTPGEGTFHFKRQWGAEPSELVWEYWSAAGQSVPDLSPHNPKFELAIRSWQRLPLRIATAVGPLIVRNIP